MGHTGRGSGGESGDVRKVVDYQLGEMVYEWKGQLTGRLIDIQNHPTVGSKAYLLVVNSHGEINILCGLNDAKSHPWLARSVPLKVMKAFAETIANFNSGEIPIPEKISTEPKPVKESEVEVPIKPEVEVPIQEEVGEVGDGTTVMPESVGATVESFPLLKLLY